MTDRPGNHRFISEKEKNYIEGAIAAEVDHSKTVLHVISVFCVVFLPLFDHDQVKLPSGKLGSCLGLIPKGEGCKNDQSAGLQVQKRGYFLKILRKN